MISDEEVEKIIKRCQADGIASFTSSNIEADRQKIFRVRRKLEREMPLFVPEFKTRVRGAMITLEVNKTAPITFVDAPATQARAKRRKKTVFVEKQEKDLEGYEADVAKVLDKFTPEQLQYHREKIMLRRIAIEYYLDTDEEVFMPVARGDSIDWDIKVAKAFDPNYDAAESTPPRTIEERIAENVRLRGEASDPRELERLCEEHEKLLKLKDEADKGKDLLG